VVVVLAEKEDGPHRKRSELFDSKNSVRPGYFNKNKQPETIIPDTFDRIPSPCGIRRKVQEMSLFQETIGEAEAASSSSD